MDILGKHTKKMIAEEEVRRAIYRILEDPNLIEVEIFLSDGKRIKLKKLSM